MITLTLTEAVLRAAGHAESADRWMLGIVGAPGSGNDRIRGEPVAGVLLVTDDVRLVVTEGNYLLHDQGGWQSVRPLLDEVWYVDITDDVRVPRLIARHIEYGKSPTAAHEWVMRSDEANAALVLGTRHRADALLAQFDS